MFHGTQTTNIYPATVTSMFITFSKTSVHRKKTISIFSPFMYFFIEEKIIFSYLYK